MILGCAIALGWCFSHQQIMHGVTVAQVRDALVVESTHSKGYYDWAEGNALNNPNYYSFYLWNMTNPEDVLKGANPNYTQVGPYYYQYIWYNRNATFLDDGNIIEYNLVEDYIYLPDKSASDPTLDSVTLVNPAYVTILQQAGGDDNMITLASLPVMSSVIDFLTGEYIDLMSSLYTPDSLSTTLQNIYFELENILSLNQSQAEDYFFQNWANGTVLPPYFLNWTGMFPIISNSSSVIPASTVSLLFSNHSYSLLDSSYTSIIYWMRAANNISGPEATELAKTFALTPPQFEAVVIWRNASFIPIYVHPILVSKAQEAYPVATLADLGWVQFVTTNITSPSFSDVFSTWYPQYATTQFEIGFYFPAVFTVAQVKMLLVGPVGVLLNLNNFGDFQAPGADLSQWGVDPTQATSFLMFLLALQPYGYPIVQDLVNSNSTGLILTRSADYWLWRCMDPLVAFLAGPENAYCGLQTNNTVQPPSQIFSGKKNLTQLGYYASWRNMTTVPYWNAPVDVAGWTDSGQFSPFLKDGQTLYIWDESFAKTLQFDSKGKTTVQGIDVYKYVMNDDAFSASELYTNSIEGFANETATNAGAPIFLSNWDFYGVNDTRYANFSGLNPSSSAVTTIYVEPNTGSTIQADEKLQVNVYYPYGANKWNSQFSQFKNVRSDIMYPLMKANQISAVSDSQAKKLRKQLVVFTPRFNTGIWWGVVVFGGLIIFVGITLLYKGYKKKPRQGYHTINP
jgi:hypothetical protein